MSSHLLVIALVLAPIPLTGAVGDSGREGQGNNPGECCGCPLAPRTSCFLWPVSSLPPRAPELCLSRPAGAGAALSQLHHGGGGFSLRSEADGMKSQRPLQAPAEALQPPPPGWREGQSMEPAGSHLPGIPLR